MNEVQENQNNLTNEQGEEEKSLSSEEVQKALTKTGETVSDQNSTVDESQVEDTLKKGTTPQISKDDPQESVNPSSIQDIQESLNKKL